jgi:hypothetical protein
LTFPLVVRETYALHQNLSYLLPRNPKHGYSAVGRVHNEAQSKEKDAEILAMLRSENVQFESIDTSEASASRVVSRVMRELELLREKVEQSEQSYPRHLMRA